jgi:alkylation response protein AidB-like acyl-CoA dehydrogenase
VSEGLDVGGRVRPQVTIEEFRVGCEAFLAARYEPKVVTRTAFVWGRGSDAVDLFDEVDPAEERATVAAVRRWRRDLWGNGLGWISGPPELGGRGLPARYQRAFDELAGRYEVPGNGKLTASLGIVAPALAAHGPPSLQHRLLPAMHAGDVIACQLFSEPGAGSDLASVSTQAVRDGEGWRITGQKVWTTGAHYSDVGMALCRTADGPRHRNLTAFVVDMRDPGVEVRPLRQMTGGSEFNEVFLTDVRVADADRIGDVGDGWAVALTTLRHERQNIGDRGFGGRGLLGIERYRRMAEVFGVSRDPIVRQAFADLVVHLRVGKYAGSRAADLARAGGGTGGEGPIAKLQLAANYQRISDYVGRVIGPALVADSGGWGTFAWRGFVLGAPSIRIGGGTDEILKNQLAERVLGLPKDAAARPVP